MYSLYPNRTTGFFWRVDRRNLALADVEAFSVVAGFGFEVPSPVSSESDSRQSDSFLSVPEFGTFLFPFSLRVNRLLGFLRGECTAESPLLAGSSSDWSNRLSRPLGPLNRSEIGLSVSISGSSGGISASLTSSSELGLELGLGASTRTRTHQTGRRGSCAPVWCEGYSTYNPSARPSNRPRCISRPLRPDSSVSPSVHAHTRCYRTPSSVASSAVFRNIARVPVLDVHGGPYRLGPVELGQALY